MQDGEVSLYYEISSMGGSEDTCAIICISSTGVFCRSLALDKSAEFSLGSRLDSDKYPQLASLAKNATSIRLFHLRSIGASEGELCCAPIPPTFSSIDLSALGYSQSLFEGQNPPAVTTVPTRFIITRDLRQWDYALCVFSAGISLQSTT